VSGFAEPAEAASQIAQSPWRQQTPPSRLCLLRPAGICFQIEIAAMYSKTAKPDAVVVTLLLFTLGTLLTATLQVMLG
jgi:hypothetical protein